MRVVQPRLRAERATLSLDGEMHANTVRKRVHFGTQFLAHIFLFFIFRKHNFQLADVHLCCLQLW